MSGALLGLRYLPAARLAEAVGALGGACFARSLPEPAPDLPLLTVDMSVADGGEALCELWHTPEPLTPGRQGPIRYRRGETLLFGCLNLDEAQAGQGALSPLRAGAEAAYLAIFELLEAQGFNTVLRFWNYFPAINSETHGMERYRQFNIGRQDAFLAHGRSVIGNVPAACALGSAGGGLGVAFLAARAEAVGVENPRQVSAYHYPSEYGPRSPTFSRAGLARLGGRPMLFISGTASILGHHSVHIGDVAAQTREALANIAAVVEEANRQAPDAGFRLADLAYKVYVRHPADLAAVRREMAAVLGGPAAAVFLIADVCRADLLVEIEASGGHDILPA